MKTHPLGTDGRLTTMTLFTRKASAPAMTDAASWWAQDAIVTPRVSLLSRARARFTRKASAPAMTDAASWWQA
jgi:hypothetical protein